MKYDAIILLGSQPNISTWAFPQHIHDCIVAASKLIKEETATYVITSGKWSLDVENKNLMQPFEECDKLADMLIERSIDPAKILKERESKDTISNLYYIKERFLIPQHMKKVLFVIASFRVPRLKLLVDLILGEQYEVDYKIIETEEGPGYNEGRDMKRQSKFLEPMKPGHHEWLADKFYEGSLYKQIRESEAA